MLPYAKPVLKWAGGKRQLLSQIDEHLPPGISEGKITTYVEPMIGGGAVFFHMKRKYGDQIKKYYISDYNWDLFVLYRVIQDRVNDLILELKSMSKEYLKAPPTKQGEKSGKRIDIYYELRDEYREDSWDKERYMEDGITLKTSINNKWVRRAALTIFMNKTCFNGLYRVCSSGKFNVPHGRYKKPDIVGSDNLRTVSKELKGVEILVGSYESNLKVVDIDPKRTFVYFDPPYRPLPNTPSFKDYHKAPFGDEEQILLSKKFSELNKKGAKLMLSNSDPKNTDENDDFFDNLYYHEDFTIHRVKARRAINSNGKKRGEIDEILVTNYEVNSDGS